MSVDFTAVKTNFAKNLYLVRISSELVGNHVIRIPINVYGCLSVIYEGWNFNFGNTPLDWIQELLE